MDSGSMKSIFSRI